MRKKNMNLPGILAFLLLSVAAPRTLNGQAINQFDYHSNMKNVPSPNTATLNTYGDVPVDLFTGTADISVPLLNVSNNGIQLPVTLSYQSGGIKVNDQPGWAGMGWNVVAGGSISRKVNQYPDEYFNRNFDLVSSGKADWGYYFVGKALNRSNWNTTTFMKAKLNGTPADSLTDLEPDEFTFNFGPYSGSFFRSEKGDWQVRSKQNLKLEITDELDYTGNYKLYRLFSVTDDSTFNNDHSGYEEIGSVFTKFTITTPDGYRYIFGEDTAAIEFSRGQIGGPAGTPQEGLAANEDRENRITANTWYLSRIITPAGDTTTLVYKRGRALYQKNLFRPLYAQNTLGPSTFDSDIIHVATAVNPSYLSRIETPTTRVDFITSRAKELGITTAFYGPAGTTEAEFKKTITYAWGGDLMYDWLFPNSTKLPNNNLQLDSIKIYNKISGAYVNGIRLYHRADITKRRTLDSLAFFDYTDASNIQKYKFTYSDVDLLPGYETLSRDHWGYANGRPESLGFTWPDRSPSSSAVLYGLLKKIIYPTGGETEFLFEPGYYSSVIKVDPNNLSSPVSLVTESGFASIRIKKITSRGIYGSPDMTREYIYTNNYAGGGSVSSGILGAYPRYIDKVKFRNTGGGVCAGDFYLTNRTDNAVEWLSQASGGIVTYSEVAEKSADGSYRVVKFTNSDDPAYRDELHDNYTNGGPAGTLGMVLENDNYRTTSNDLERGKVLNEALYNASGTKVKESVYTYRNDPARKNSFIKAFAFKTLYERGGSSCSGTWPTGGGPRAWTYRIYTYQNPLKSVTETQYESGNAITTSQSFVYDDYGNVTQQTTVNSAGEMLITDTRYNSHPDYQGTATGASALGIKRLLANYKIKNYPVEQTTLLQPSDPLEGTFTNGTLYMYDLNRPVVWRVYKMELDAPFRKYTVSGGTGTLNYIPSMYASGSLSFNSKYQLQENVTAYTSAKCLPLTVAQKASSVAYTWDNRFQSVSSITTSAVNSDVAYCNFEGSYGVIDDNKGNWDFGADYIESSATAPMGNKVLRLVSNTLGAQHELRTMDSLVAGKRYVFSFWIPAPVVASKFPKAYINNTTLLPDATAKKTVNGWVYHELAFTAENRKLYVRLPNAASGTVSNTLDEVRLYPEGAAMKSYTYDAVNGNVTNSCDEHGVITHYEYDGMGRLVRIKDEQGNIINQNTYKYQGAE
ncbi:RHS repeat protein [Niabella sp. CC-SYL272]|uniref:RHS repeat domain-containing protein n=1 Tax=Niabella agricola TaxID=2891571 RepID=UPI001F17C503|nr:RHS repeat domain-containing protein [Niabella agricola]MCF3109590.1 RHS repeat protein [Niabella agricola]